MVTPLLLDVPAWMLPALNAISSDLDIPIEQLVYLCVLQSTKGRLDYPSSLWQL